MIEMHLRAADLAETSFAISPLQETVFSLWVRRSPDKLGVHLPWLAETADAFVALDTAVLLALVSPTKWIPDFLTPRPDGPLTEFTAELAAVAATPPRLVRAGIGAAYREAAVPEVLQGRPSVVLRRVVAALGDYWRACLEPHWPRMRSVLEADVVHRSRELARGGARAVFADLDGRVRWDDGLLFLDRLPGEVRRIEVDGRGLRLTPSLFVRSALTYIDTAEPPLVVYPARGRGTVWAEAAPAADDALVALVGAVRARLLTMLDRPASTTELAHRLRVTPSAVSQHLAVLHAARLLNRARSGRSVLYLRSALADELVGSGQAGRNAG